MKILKKNAIVSLIFTAILSFLLIKIFPNPVLFYVAAVFTGVGTICAVQTGELAQPEANEAEKRAITRIVIVLGFFLSFGFCLLGIGQSYLGLYNLFLWLDPGAILCIFVYGDFVVEFMRNSHILFK